MLRWNTSYIERIIVNKFKHKYNTRLIGSGGDHDTTEIYVKAKNSDGGCSIQGWLTSNCFGQSTNLNDCDVDIISVAYDRHGLVNASPKDLRVVADITELLESNDFNITNQGWKSFF